MCRCLHLYDCTIGIKLFIFIIEEFPTYLIDNNNQTVQYMVVQYFFEDGNEIPVVLSLVVVLCGPNKWWILYTW